jgi:hypoxanthine phosphoribosyltransferase
VELTTLRAKLMRLKHQKIKLIKELYPDVNVKLWSRRDFDRFLERFGLEERRQELVGKEAMRSAHG